MYVWRYNGGGLSPKGMCFIHLQQASIFCLLNGGPCACTCAVDREFRLCATNKEHQPLPNLVKFPPDSGLQHRYQCTSWGSVPETVIPQ